jgi:cytochrome c oxidase subunit IV
VSQDPIFRWSFYWLLALAVSTLVVPIAAHMIFGLTSFAVIYSVVSCILWVLSVGYIVAVEGRYHLRHLIGAPFALFPVEYAYIYTMLYGK